MSLLAPAWLGLLGLLPLIALLHVRRRRTIAVPSVRLWQRLAPADRASTSFRWPPPNLLMLLQMLVVVLLALALARPQPAATGGADHLVVLVDASGSMHARDGSPTRMADATALVAARLRDGPSPAPVVSIVEVGSVARPVALRLPAPAAADAAVGVGASFGPADWLEAERWLEALTRASERTELWIVTDGPGAADVAATLGGRADGITEVTVVGGDLPNVSLVGVSVAPDGRGRFVVNGEVRWSGFATVDEAPDRVRVEAHVLPDGAASALLWSTVEVTPTPRGGAEFTMEVELAQRAVLELRLPGDAVPFDDRIAFVVDGAPEPVRVLHVGARNDPLRAAFAAMDGVTLERSEELPVDSASYDLVVVDRVAVPRHPGTNTLWLGVLPPAGHPGSGWIDPVDLDPGGWAHDHPLVDDVQLSDLRVFHARIFPYLAGAVPLLEATGYPLVQARTTEHGREVVASFHLVESSWPSSVGFPSFLANLLDWSAPGRGRAVHAPCLVGRPCVLDPRTAATTTILDPAGAGLDVVLPSVGSVDGGGERWFPDGLDAGFVPLEPGVHRIVADGVDVPVAVQVGGAVDRLAAAPPGDVRDAAAAPRTPLVPWRLLLVLALGVLIAETVLAGWWRERFLRPSSLGRSNPAASRRRLVLGLRVGALVVLLVAVADPTVVRNRAVGQTIVVADRPELFQAEAREAVEATVEAIAASSSADHRVDLVRLASPDEVRPRAADADADADGAAELATVWGLSDGIDTALAAAGRMEGTRVVVLTDGTRPGGPLLASLARTRGAGVAVDVVPVGGLPPGEVLVERLEVPPRLHASQEFALQAIVVSELRTLAVARVFRDGAPIAEERVALVAGRNRIEVPVMEPEAGDYLYEVSVEAGGDANPGNDRAGVVASVSRVPRVGIFSRETLRAEYLAEALQLQGIPAEVLAVDVLPETLGGHQAMPGQFVGAVELEGYGRGWLDYDVAVLMNVRAIDIGWQQQASLVEWVRDHGGGLIVLGGEHTLGPGGYYLTLLEEVLPLATDVPHERPTVAISFVLDRSASMRAPVGDGDRLDVAKVATLGAVEMLSEESAVGVVVFDFDATELVPMTPASELSTIEALLEPLVPFGGTNIHAGLVLGVAQLLEIEPETTRHIVLMTDGLGQGGFDYEPILETLVDAGITLSAAAIGQGADLRLTEMLAAVGGGTAYATTDFEAFPSIMAQEVLMLTEDPVREERFLPSWRDRSAPFLDGMPQQLPALGGYVRSTPKPAADVHLRTADDDPILASWRFGLGRVVALATHGAGPWASDWMTMPEYPTLWAQTVRWTMPVLHGPGLNVEVDRVGDDVRVRVEALTPSGDPSAALELTAEVVDGDGTPIARRSMIEVDSGRYVAMVPVRPAGTHEVVVRSLTMRAVTAATEEAAFEEVRVPVHVSYPDRLAFAGSGADVLAAVASATGGRIVSDPVEVWRPTLATVPTSVRAWPLAALAALALLVADLTARTVSWPVRARRRTTTTTEGRVVPQAGRVR